MCCKSRNLFRLVAFVHACCAVVYADLPDGWTSQDIGSPVLSGTVLQSYGVWTVSGGGTEIGGSADQFHFVSRTLQGNGTVTAYVDDIGMTNGWARSGVMIRNNPDADAAFAAVVVTPENSVLFQWRAAAGESTQTIAAGGIVPAPLWVRLTRCGNAAAGEFSYDGIHWVQLGQPEAVGLDASAAAGLSVCAGGSNDLSSATFSGVAVLPVHWENLNVGGSVVRGSTTFDGEVITVSARGSTGTSSDQFHYASQCVVGDVAIVAKVDGLSGGGSAAKAGVMIRDGIDAGDRYAFSFIAPNAGSAGFECRSVENTAADSSASTSGIAPSAWIKLVRRGNMFTAYYSANGITWIQNGAPVEMEMHETVRVGIGVASGGGTMATATFSHLQVLPPEWAGVDIGEPGLTGSEFFDGLEWQVNGGGADIWGSADQMHYVRRYYTGDLVIVAKVDSVLNTATWEKAGVMIRDGAGAAAAHAAVYVRPNAGDSTFEYRDGTGGETQSDGSSSGAVAPRWLRLERKDDLFTAYQSSDGKSWIAIGTADVPMESTVQVGLAVCANDNDALNSAVFSDVFVGSEYRSPFLCVNGIYFKNHHGVGDIVKLRGTNIGGWMLHEEWINGMDGDNYGTSVLIAEDFVLRDTLESRFGRAMANRISAQFEDHWFTESDLDNMRALGLNVLRVPFSYRCLIDSDNNWRSDAFTQLDWVVDEAWKRGIHTILDMHGAPGGASPFFSSGIIGGGALWTNPVLQDLAIDIWKNIAEHYAGHPGVVAYDLLNEPVPPSTDALNSLYDRMYDAIRAVDPDHCIIMGAGGGEGVGGFYWSIHTLPDPGDMGWSNVAYQSHSYATTTDSDPEGEAQWQVTQHGLQPDVPMLIGEFNLGDGQAYGVQLWDDNNINWTQWTYKARYGNEALHWGIYKGNTWPLTPDLTTDSAESILAAYAATSPTEGNYSLDTRNRTIYGTPLLENDGYTTSPGSALYVAPADGVLANDWVPNAGQTNIEAHAYPVQEPANGSLALWEDGSFYYLPDEGFAGSDTFRYFVWDNVNDSANVATVCINVTEQPKLALSMESSGEAHLSWPEWADGFQCALYTTTNLVTSEWNAATNMATLHTNSLVVTISDAAGTRFYKLVQP